VEAHAADSERIVHALVGTGDETIERKRDPEAKSGHLGHPAAACIGNAAAVLSPPGL
jgi:hypothetical protein